MYSFAILAAILIAFVALTNALQCRPSICMIYCPYGFDIDAQGCEICSCRRPPVSSPQTTNRLGATNTTTTRVTSTTTKAKTTTTAKTRPTTTTKAKTTTTAKTRPTTTTRHALNAMSSTATARRWFRSLLS
jgi:hypothetical protein